MKDDRKGMTDGEGMTPEARAALDLFVTGVREAYGGRLVGLWLFGSRARGDASAMSDVAVVLDEVTERKAEQHRLSDIAYDVIVETTVEVHAIAFAKAEWEGPHLHRNPSLVVNARRDGRPIEVGPA